VNCTDCSAPLTCRAISCYCRRCHERRRCRTCRAPLPAAGLGCCDDCRALAKVLYALHKRDRTHGFCGRPDQDGRAKRIERYAQRAEQSLPLFEEVACGHGR
jgi:hypothetical protein